MFHTQPLQLALRAAAVRVARRGESQDKAALRALIKQKADVNAVMPDGATALHWAAHWDDLESASLLLKAGANVNAKNDYEVTPLALAVENGSLPDGAAAAAVRRQREHRVRRPARRR